MKCKDCEYYGTYDSPDGSTTWCKNENGLPGELDPEDGCSRGKRKMSCTECNKAKQDPQTGDYYCTQKGCLVGQQEDCKERDDNCCDYNASCGCWDRMGYMCCDSQGATGR